MTYQTVERHYPPRPLEALYVADETDHVQWMPVPEDVQEEPFSADSCAECDGQHVWRTVWVRA